MRSIFANTYLDASILPTGFIDWSPSHYNNPPPTLQAEFENFGPGFNATARAKSLFDVQLNATAWAKYSSPAEVFQFVSTTGKDGVVGGRFGNVGWIDFGA